MLHCTGPGSCWETAEDRSRIGDVLEASGLTLTAQALDVGQSRLTAKAFTSER